MNFALPTDWFSSMMDIDERIATSSESARSIPVAEQCKRQDSGDIATSELVRIEIVGSMALPQVLSLNLKNDSSRLLKNTGQICISA